MKRLVIVGMVLSCLLILTPAVHGQTGQQLLQGTQVRLQLLSGLSTRVAHDGDPFTAQVSEPVFVGGQMILPAGAKIHGVVGSIVKPRFFAMFRGEAMMNLQFRSIEVEGREIPAQMSIIQIFHTTDDGIKARKDLKTEEGAVVEVKRDIKTDIITVGLGTTGGSIVGAIFSHVMRGFAFGMAGSAGYIIVKKGKNVELPAQTGILVRLDATVAMPVLTASVTAASSSN